jgi:hypothetical protein
MDRTGHTTLAEWSTADRDSMAAALAAFRDELDRGSIAVVAEREGEATQVRELPVDAELVIMRQPIAGG